MPPHPRVLIISTCLHRVDSVEIDLPVQKAANRPNNAATTKLRICFSLSDMETFDQTTSLGSGACWVMTCEWWG
jgi:hypothetical protein